MIGIHPNFPINVYHQDPCPEPSLSNSIGKILVHECPRKAWAAHPRLGRSAQVKDEHEEKFSIGTAAHSELFERGKDLWIVDAKNWSTKDAKAERDKALLAGKTPILRHQMMRVEKMIESVQQQMQLHETGPAFFGAGAGKYKVDDEVMIVWTEEIDGRTIWCRSLIDRLCVSDEEIRVFDFKSTEVTVSDYELPRLAYGMNYHMQCAFIARGLQVLLNQPIADRLKFNFIFAEVKAPFMVNVKELSKGGFVLGAKQVAQAFALWKRCIETNNWPGYSRQATPLEVPPWIENRWLERELSDAYLLNTDKDPFLVASPWIAEDPTKRIDVDNIDPS